MSTEFEGGKWGYVLFFFAVLFGITAIRGLVYWFVWAGSIF